MKSEFKSKFLQHLATKKHEEGFTLIELLVVIIIIGILAAIALPSFLNQAAKAKQVEAQNNVGSVNRAQQAFRLGKTQFATDWNALATDVAFTTESVNYKYSLIVTTPKDFAEVQADPNPDDLRGYLGRVQLLTGGVGADRGSVGAVAQSTNKGAAATLASGSITFDAAGKPSCNASCQLLGE